MNPNHRYIAIKMNGEITVHIPHTTSVYATLCNLDGDDPSPDVAQEVVPVPKGRKVDCQECKAIVRLIRENGYNLKDLEP